MNETAGNHEISRRANMQRLVELGIDPWGARFDNRDLIGSVRERASEVKFRKGDGTLIDLPNFTADSTLDYRQWKADQGQGEEIGPTVRVAGRVIRLGLIGLTIDVNRQPWCRR